LKIKLSQFPQAGSVSTIHRIERRIERLITLARAANHPSVCARIMTRLEKARPNAARAKAICPRPSHNVN